MKLLNNVTLLRVSGRAVCLAAGILFQALEIASADEAAGKETAKASAFLLSLTEEERAWLRDHPVVSVAMSPDWPPIEFIDEQGEPAGISEDYLRLMERLLGVRFERVRVPNWHLAYERLRRWEIDMSPCVAETPERTEFWAFTKPYMSIPIVLVADRRVPYIADMRELAGRKVTVIDNHALVEWLSHDFPKIELIKVPNTSDGLEAVLRGEAFAYVDAMLVVGHYLTLPQMGMLKIVGQTPYSNTQCMAVRKDWPLFVGILDKALASVAEAERMHIYRRWVPVYVERGYDRARLWKIVAGFMIGILVLAVWVGKLAFEVSRRKKAEIELRVSEERYRGVLESLPDAICRWRPDTTLTFANRRYRELFGLAADAPLGMKWVLFLPENNRETTEQFYSELARNPRQAFYEHQVVSADGAVRWFQWVDTPLYDSNGELLEFQSIGRDVTEQKRRNLMHEISLDVLEILNEPSETRECLGRIFDVLKQRMPCDAIGVRLQDGDDFPYLFHHGFSEEFLQAENSLLQRDAGGEICRDADGKFSFECVCGMVVAGKTDSSKSFFTRGGSFWTNDCRAMADLPPEERPCCRLRNYCSASGFVSMALIPIRTPEQIVGLLHLASRRKYCFLPGEIAGLEEIAGHIGAAISRRRAESELREAMFVLKTAGRIARFGGWSVDLESSRVVVSDEVAAVLGKPPGYSPPVEETFLFYAPEWRERMVEFFNRCAREGVPYDEEVEGVIEGGRRLWVRIVGEAVRDATGRIVRVCGAVQDITDRRMLEAQFLQAQKMEAIGRLVGGVAHDFNNMAMGIIGDAELAREKLPPEHPAQTDLKEILAGVRRATAMTRQLLAIARKEPINPLKINLNSEISKMLEMLKRLAGEEIELKWRPGADLWPVKMDSSQLAQVLINLCTNARDAINGGGKITIETKNTIIP